MQARAPGSFAASLLIVVFLLAQILIPASYYLVGDRNDERFAWRMFSAHQQASRSKHNLLICHELIEVEGQEVWQSVSVSGETLAAWHEKMRRRQPDVIRRYLKSRLQNSHAKQTRLRIARCDNGEDLHDIESWLLDHATQSIHVARPKP